NGKVEVFSTALSIAQSDSNCRGWIVNEGVRPARSRNALDVTGQSSYRAEINTIARWVIIQTKVELIGVIRFLCECASTDVGPAAFRVRSLGSLNGNCDTLRNKALG